MLRSLVFSDYEQFKLLAGQVHDYHVKNRPDLFSKDGFLNQDYFNRILSGSMNYVYEVDGRLCGVLVAFVKEDTSHPVLLIRKVCIVDLIVVDSEFTMQGIGHVLFDHLLKDCKSRGIPSVELVCYPFNSSAVQFYEEFGFTVKNIKYEYLL